MKRFVVILAKGSIKAGCKPFPLVQTVQIPCQLEQLYMSRSSCRVLYCSVHQWYVWSAFGARKTCTLLSPLDTFFSWNPFLLHFCFFWQPFLMPPGFWQLLSHAKTLSRTLIKISIGFWHLVWPRGANGASASDQQRLNSTIWHGLMVERKTKIIQTYGSMRFPFVTIRLDVELGKWLWSLWRHYTCGLDTFHPVCGGVAMISSKIPKVFTLT